MNVLSKVSVRAHALAGVLLLALAAPALADGENLPMQVDGPQFTITSLNLRYATEHEALPTLEPFFDLAVKLFPTPDGWVAAREGMRGNEYVKLSRMPIMPDQRYYASAIRSISLGIVKKFGRMGHAGISVQVDPTQIGPDGQDLRPANDKSLTLVINAVTVADIHTVGAGERVPEESKRDHPAHAYIGAKSPIAPQEGNLIDRNALEHYMHWLNRHPGRRVDAAVARGEDPGSVDLEYVVQENRPWLVYFQASNTGTESTGRWRERFGAVHNQLTGNDDILSLTYVTGNFDDVHAFVGSYEAPFFPFARVDGLERWRWKVTGTYNEFEASQFGFDDPFAGHSWSIGGEVIWNFFQRDTYFVDAFAGITYQDIYNENPSTEEEGDEQFFRPRVGLRMQHIEDTFSTFGSLSLDFNVPGVAGTDDEEASLLGRADASDSWVVVMGDLTHSFYLDPLLYGKAWDDASTPETSTLAHEIVLSLRGQASVAGDRLIPQMQQTVGGLYTVRGYRESASVGDHAVVGSLEYRFHVPRVFDIEPEPRQLFGQPFRYAPQGPYGRTDWDLVLKAFVDAGYTANVESDDDPFEAEGQPVVGAGFGVDLSIKRNFSVRVDWAWALHDIPDRTRNGSSQVHIVATLTY